MNKNQRKWVRALRSGKYRQTRGQLKGKVGHCCLGVACELAVKAGVIDSYVGSDAVLPDKVASWLGINEYSGMFIDKNNDTRSLVVYNDSAKYNFDKIADIIVKNQNSIFKKV